MVGRTPRGHPLGKNGAMSLARPTRAALADAESRVFWTDRSEAPTARAPLTGRESADLLVVGAGYTGLWAAIQAKEENPARDVVLAEADVIGAGASGRNAGVVVPTLTHGLTHGARLWPDDLDLLVDLGDRNFASLVVDLRRHGIEADFRLPGRLTVAIGAGQAARMAEAHDAAAAHGKRELWLGAAAVQERVHVPHAMAGVFDREVGLLDPARLVWGLAAAAERLGVRVHEGSPVTSVRTEPGGVHGSCAGVSARLRSGRVRAGKVLVATGSNPVLRRQSAWMATVFGHTLVSEQLSLDQLEHLAWGDSIALQDAAARYRHYRLTSDNRLLVGGHDTNYERGEVNPSHRSQASFEDLARHTLAVFPCLGALRYTHRWAGPVATTTRLTPVFGRALSGRAVYVGGYMGLGIASARFGARVALDLLDGRRTRATTLAMVRRKPVAWPPDPARSAAMSAMRRAQDATETGGGRSLLVSALERVGVRLDA
ncbi:MAG: NAD(P)/FAD-dependent oxidoreductase [Actinomycetales bacterium]